VLMERFPDAGGDRPPIGSFLLQDNRLGCILSRAHLLPEVSVPLLQARAKGRGEERPKPLEKTPSCELMAQGEHLLRKGGKPGHSIFPRIGHRTRLDGLLESDHGESMDREHARGKAQMHGGFVKRFLSRTPFSQPSPLPSPFSGSGLYKIKSHGRVPHPDRPHSRALRCPPEA